MYLRKTDGVNYYEIIARLNTFKTGTLDVTYELYMQAGKNEK